VNADRWRQMEALYHEAAAPETGTHRTEFLDRACAGDPEMRLELDSLFEHESEAEHFLESDALDAPVSAPAQPRVATGQRLGPYEILGLLGAGGMSEVIRALDPRTGRVTALKLLAPALAADDGWVRRFQKEARAVASLQHRGIPALYESGAIDGQRFIAAELVEGPTLRRRMEQARLIAGEAVERALQVADALAAAHAAGIVHRDIKPENLMVATAGTVVVLDFGLPRRTVAPAAGSALAEGSSVTAPGTAVGTLAYMSPERVRGERVDSRTDLYSLGVVLYEMLAGRLSFELRTPTYTMMQILHAEAPRADELAPQVPAALSAMVARAMG
jgi:eukaryotic-like serine/threonine-protein kinase